MRVRKQVGRIKVERKEPNFFIVGACRSGTTSLANYLGQHPGVYISPVKEPGYFLANYALDDYDEYISLFKKAGSAQAIGEASTGYLFEQGAARAIHERFPDAKIIMMLRNPVDMAFSLWVYMVVNGSESKSFEDSITPEEREYRSGEQFKKTCASWSWYASYLYIERALYFNQVKRYIDTFGQDQVRIYIFENFIRAPIKICQDIFGFLEVDRHFVPQCKILNESGEFRFPVIRKLRNGFYPILKALLPLGFRTKLTILMQPVMATKEKRASMNPATRKASEALWGDDIVKLESLLGYEIREWKLR